MPVTTKSTKSPSIKAKARQLLAFAQEQARQGKRGEELFVTIFGSRGKARMLFPAKTDWAALERTDEFQEILKLVETITNPPAHEVGSGLTNGALHVTLRLPKSLHTALLAEAAAEGVSLEQLCLSKLVAQLRELV